MRSSRSLVNSPCETIRQTLSESARQHSREATQRRRAATHLQPLEARGSETHTGKDAAAGSDYIGVLEDAVPGVTEWRAGTKWRALPKNNSGEVRSAQCKARTERCMGGVGDIVRGWRPWPSVRPRPRWQESDHMLFDHSLKQAAAHRTHLQRRGAVPEEVKMVQEEGGCTCRGSC
jgi:hypothetical protein